jgi:hypothetical protein
MNAWMSPGPSAGVGWHPDLGSPVSPSRHLCCPRRLAALCRHPLLRTRHALTFIAIYSIRVAGRDLTAWDRRFRVLIHVYATAFAGLAVISGVTGHQGGLSLRTLLWWPGLSGTGAATGRAR